MTLRYLIPIIRHEKSSFQSTSWHGVPMQPLLTIMAWCTNDARLDTWMMVSLVSASEATRAVIVDDPQRCAACRANWPTDGRGSRKILQGRIVSTWNWCWYVFKWSMIQKCLSCPSHMRMCTRRHGAHIYTYIYIYIYIYNEYMYTGTWTYIFIYIYIYIHICFLFEYTYTHHMHMFIIRIYILWSYACTYTYYEYIHVYHTYVFAYFEIYIYIYIILYIYMIMYSCICSFIYCHILHTCFIDRRA